MCVPPISTKKLVLTHFSINLLNSSKKIESLKPNSKFLEPIDGCGLSFCHL